MKSAETTARALNVGLGPIVEVRRAEEIAGAFAAIAKEADGVLVVGGTMVFANRAELTRQTLKLPLMCNLRDEAEAGCVMSYGVSLPELFRRAAVPFCPAPPFSPVAIQQSAYDIVTESRNVAGAARRARRSSLAEPSQWHSSRVVSVA